MEKINGFTISQLCNKKLKIPKMSEEEKEENKKIVWIFFKKGVEALLNLSTQKILHRDLHGNNILLQFPTKAVLNYIDSNPRKLFTSETDYILKIIDFGEAKDTSGGFMT